MNGALSTRDFNTEKACSNPPHGAYKRRTSLSDGANERETCIAVLVQQYLDASSHLYMRVCPVCRSVRPFVCPPFFSNLEKKQKNK